MSEIGTPTNINKKWGHLRKILERSGPFDKADFSPSEDNLNFLMNDCKILVIGKSKMTTPSLRLH